MRRPAGLSAWWIQRISAVYLLLFSLFFLASQLIHPQASHSAWKAWVGQHVIVFGLAVFFLALLAHMWVGLRDVLLDYAKPEHLRNGLLYVLALSLLLLGSWVLWILFRLYA